MDANLDDKEALKNYIASGIENHVGNQYCK